MTNVARLDANQEGWQRILSFLATVVVSAAIALAVTGCGGGGGGTPALTVAAPGAPTDFSVATTNGTLSATLVWSAPISGGDPASYEIYRTKTDPGIDPILVMQEANNIISIPAEATKTSYTFVDNAGLTRGDTWWVVSAKNAGGETPSANVETAFLTGPPGGSGDTGYGNNFAAAMIFADNIGISGLPITGTWTTALSGVPSIDTNTGLRPSAAEVADLLPAVITLPYLDPTTAYTKNYTTYYKQQTVSTWQGEWATAGVDDQHVTAKWGDNLISQSLTANSTIRVEMVLSKVLTTPMKSYWMESLFGARENEIQGTDGTTYDNSTAFVFASNARLKIEKLDAGGTPIVPALYDQPLWQGDGPGYLAGEVNVSGNFTYGFVWNLKNQLLPPEITSKPGTWRLTFSLDPDNSLAGTGTSGTATVTPPPANNNTFIDTAANGVRVSDTEVYIDINVGQ
jgi:hypothetical protein